MRLFIAINFCAEVKSKIVQIQDKLRQSAVCGNFTARENLHLTLFFFGEGFDSRLPAIERVLDALKAPAFELQIQGMGFFKHGQRDIWWVGVQENAPLTRVHSEIRVGIAKENLFPAQSDSFPFRPHVTIARGVVIGRGNDLPADHGIPINTCVHEICLMKSERVSGKLVYTPVHTKRLPAK